MGVRCCSRYASPRRAIDEFARLAEAYQPGAHYTRFPCDDKADDRNVIGANRPTMAVPEVRDTFAKQGVDIALMNPNQLGAFLEVEAARFRSLLKNSRVSRIMP